MLKEVNRFVGKSDKAFLRIALFIFVLFLPFMASAQRFQGAVAFGTNLTQVDGDEAYGFKKFGFNVAAIAIIPFKEKWALSLEASFSQKGAYEKYPRESNPSKSLPYYNLRLNYAEVPLMIHFTDKKFLTVGLGLSWGKLVGVKEIEWGKQTKLNLYSGDYNANDFNIMVDVRVPIYKRLYFNFKYAYSLAKIRTREFSNYAGYKWKRKQYNNVLTFRILYVLNKQKTRSND